MALKGARVHDAHPYRQASIYYLGYHRPDLQGQQTCLRAVVQLPRVALEAHPPRADLPVDLVRQVGDPGTAPPK